MGRERDRRMGKGCDMGGAAGAWGGDEARGGAGQGEIFKKERDKAKEEGTDTAKGILEKGIVRGSDVIKRRTRATRVRMAV